MSIDIAQSEGRSLGERRRGGRIAGVAAVLAVVLALAVAAPAWATPSGTATLAPIGTGSYLLTIQNTGADEIKSLSAVGSSEGFSNFDPAGCIPAGGGFICVVSIAPGASTQICYSGPAVTQVSLEITVHVPVTSAPAVASCPLPGFTPAPVVPAPSAGGTGSAPVAGGGTAGSGGSGHHKHKKHNHKHHKHKKHKH
ncbi:MAG TPA: hypothetical protein VII45_02040 [Solirubrobacterales bacterium]